MPSPALPKSKVSVHQDTRANGEYVTDIAISGEGKQTVGAEGVGANHAEATGKAVEKLLENPRLLEHVEKK